MLIATDCSVGVIITIIIVIIIIIISLMLLLLSPLLLSLLFLIITINVVSSLVQHHIFSKVGVFPFTVRQSLRYVCYRQARFCDNNEGAEQNERRDDEITL